MIRKLDLIAFAMMNIDLESGTSPQPAGNSSPQHNVSFPYSILHDVASLITKNKLNLWFYKDLFKIMSASL